MVRLRTVLSENIKAYRKERGLSQMKLADLVDAAPNYIAMIEAGKRFPSDTMIEKIASALQCEPVELFSVSPLQTSWKVALLDELAAVLEINYKESRV